MIYRVSGFEPGRFCRFALVVSILLAAPSWAAPATEPTVIVLSFDGTRWDYPDRASLPALERMARAFRLEVIVTGIAVVIFIGLAVATMI